MKTFVVLFLKYSFLFTSLGTGLSAMAQGQLVFNNRITNALIAPVYNVEPSDATIAKQGNTASGTPAGGQTYNGALLAGNGYTAQLFGGTTNTATEDLVALSPATTFRTTNSAGFVLAPPNAVTVPGVPEGQSAKIQMRSWQNFGGTITNWQQVLANTNIPRGESLSFITPPLGGLFIAPPNLEGLRSFNLFLPKASVGPIQIVSSDSLTNGNFSFSFTATTNQIYTVQASSDLTNWLNLVTNVFVPTSPWTFEHTNTDSSSNRFYRVKWP